MKLTRLIAGAVLLPAAFLIGCASSPSAEPTAGAGDTSAVTGASVVTVLNNHSSAREMTIYLEPQGRGQRQRLGTVSPGQTATFSHAIASGYYTLTAAHDMGELNSSNFNVQGASNVRWVLNTNRVTVSSR